MIHSTKNPLDTVRVYSKPLYITTQQIHTFKVVSWNVQGMRSPNKRMRVLRHLRKLKADIALLQETHLGEQDYFRLRKLWVGKVFGSPAQGKKGGVITLLHKTIKLPLQGNCRELWWWGRAAATDTWQGRYNGVGGGAACALLTFTHQTHPGWPILTKWHPG